MDSPHLWGNEISRSDGIILLIGFAAFMLYTFQMARKDGLLPKHEEVLGEEEEVVPRDYSRVWRHLCFIVLGLVCLIVGSDLFVDAASYIAHRYGVRQSIVGLTIVAGGTSLPELATSVVAAYKGRSALALGNVIGSNVHGYHDCRSDDDARQCRTALAVCLYEILRLEARGCRTYLRIPGLYGLVVLFALKRNTGVDEYPL